MRGGNSDITILPNVNTLQCILNVVGTKVKVSFDVQNTLANVLGFNKSTCGVGRHASEQLVHNMSVNSILVHFNIIHSSYMQAPVVYNFFPNAAPGQKILEAPSNLIYLPVTVDAALTPLIARALPLAARVLPTIMPGLATGLLSGGVHKAISGNGVVGYGLYLHKHDKCYRVQKLKGNGLYLAPLIHVLSKVLDCSRNMVMISVMVLVCSWGRIVRLRIFPFWNGYCDYLFVEEMYIKA